MHTLLKHELIESRTRLLSQINEIQRDIVNHKNHLATLEDKITYVSQEMTKKEKNMRQVERAIIEMDGLLSTSEQNNV